MKNSKTAETEKHYDVMSLYREYVEEYIKVTIEMAENIQKLQLNSKYGKYGNFLSEEYSKVNKRIYVQKPVYVEAVQWTGKNQSEIQNFIGETGNCLSFSDMMSINGDMIMCKNDFLLKHINGEFMVCKESTFRKSYRRL